jgi:uncharacterized repeat protein (TIGR01451 family)
MKNISTSLRSLFLTLIFISVFCEMQAQMVYIPDAAFRNKLTSLGYGSCIVGDSIDSTCPAVVSTISLDISVASIYNLQGIQAFYNLDSLDCIYNHLNNTLPFLPSSLTYLKCYANYLDSLPNLPNSLTYLACNGNQLSSLSTLPNSLIYLRCDGNPLGSLPTLPTSLETLYCPNTQIHNLPILPNSLRVLACSDNPLTALPNFPNSLKTVFLQNTYISNLIDFDLPDSLNYLNLSHNSFLTCLPRLKRIVTLDFSNTGIMCLPNLGNVTSSTPPLSSFPLCGIFNDNDCPFSWNIRGSSYLDTNNNCIDDTSEIQLPDINAGLYQNNNLLSQTLTNLNGNYGFAINDSGVYEVRVDTSNIPFDLVCSITNYIDTVTPTDSLSNRNFAFKCKQGFDVGAWSILPNHPFVPAGMREILIGAGDLANQYSVHCLFGISGTVTIIFNGAISYVSADTGALTPTSVNGDTITWNVSDFGLLNVSGSFNFIIQTDTLATLGSQVCFTVIVAAQQPGDYNAMNDTLVQCFKVVGSYDPNEKEVFPIDDINPNLNNWITYTIHFQNTGSWFAEHIYIDDTLSSNFDLSTFQLLAYSHQPIVQILEGGIARFNFPNINLPDSGTNEPASHGYVQYKIKLKNGLTIGTQITNTAYIYFDFNSPVVTNTTSNTLVVTGISSIANNNVQLKVYPNPSTDIFHFQFSDSREQIKRIEITDITGREVYSVEKNVNELNTSELMSGVYFYSVITKNEKLFVGKLIKN